MSQKSKSNAKKGLIAVLATGAVVGLGVGIKAVKTRIKAQREAQREAESLQSLEDDRFGED